MKPAKMTEEDRAYFKEGVKSLCGIELLEIKGFINDKEIKKRIAPEDFAFMTKELGRQAGAIWARLLRALKKSDYKEAEEVLRGKRNASYHQSGSGDGNQPGNSKGTVTAEAAAGEQQQRF